MTLQLLTRTLQLSQQLNQSGIRRAVVFNRTLLQPWSGPKSPLSKTLTHFRGEGGGTSTHPSSSPNQAAPRTPLRRLPTFAATIFLLAVPALATTLSANDFGAKGDGVTLNTAAIQKALDAAEASHATVTLHPGTYLTGSLFLKSNVTLQLDKGVTLLGSQNIADYPMMPSRIAGIEMTWPAALVNIYRQDHATLTGEGAIDGDGKIFWDFYWALRKTYEPRGLRWASDYDARRPRLVQIFDSKAIKVGGGLLLRRSGFWTLHICYSTDVTVDNLTIRNNEGGRGPSTDGIDIDSSSHILVQHADIAVNDDALCLKAGRDSDGLRVGRPTTDVILRDNIVRDGAAGVTFGSETSGGFRNIEAFNITTQDHVPIGILFKSAHTRGGYAENINLHDFNMVGTPVVLRVTMNWNPAYSYATIPEGIKDYPPLLGRPHHQGPRRPGNRPRPRRPHLEH